MKYLLIICLTLALCGCVSVGHKIDQTKVAQIKVGQTTRAQVLQLIGSPDQLTTANGVVYFNYMFIHSSPTAATYIPLVGAFAGGANTQNESVMITFTNDVVSALTSSVGGTDAGVGAAAASTEAIPAVSDNKRPK